MTSSAQRQYLAVCVGTTVYALVYLLVDYARLPRLYHFQLEHELRLAVAPGGVASGYVGLWCWALLAGTVAGGAMWLLSGRMRVGARALGLAAAWTGTAMAIAAGYYAWNNWP